MASETPKAPAGLSPRARAFWKTIVDGYELTPDTMETLREAVATMTTIDKLSDALDTDGLLVAGSKGQPRAHPALSEIRGQRGVLQRLLRGLAIEEDAPEVSQSPGEAQRSERARKAARRRWDRR